MQKNDNKIFCIGFNKTGSTSLITSINRLGFKIGDMNKGELCLIDVIKGDLTSTFSLCESATAFKDIPFSLPGIWYELYKVYPTAKYILSERDSAEQWYSSITRFHTKAWSKNKSTPTWKDLKESTKVSYKGLGYDYIKYTFNTEGNPYDKTALIDVYNKHNHDVKEFFKNSKNFLTINVSRNDDYLRLCNFLNVKPLDRKFPHKKKT